MQIEGIAIDPVAARCPHFGVCGGCQLQMVSYEEQLRIKQARLGVLLDGAGVIERPALEVHASEPWGYRNRIRLRVQRVDGAVRVGYNRGTTTEFLPITTCPIAAPVLWQCAEAMLALAAEDKDAATWLDVASALELFGNDAGEIRLTLHYPSRKAMPPGSFERMIKALRRRQPTVVSAAVFKVDGYTGQMLRQIAAVGSEGLSYRVTDETYWIRHGGFFQVNRFLLRELVNLVCDGRRGSVAWDLFAGVGLFSRVLARSFEQVTAVEFDPAAVNALAAGLAKIGSPHRGVTASTLDFLRSALVQRERPELVVLDPPRAGAGLEACDLLLQLAPKEMVYVSCDPGTLARDLARLQSGYRVEALHLVDLFPQTTHQETVVVLKRKA